MNDIAQSIREARNIKETTLSTYMRTLKRVHEQCGHTGECTSLEFLCEHEHVLDSLPVKATTRKNHLAACVVALSAQTAQLADSQRALDIYRQHMVKHIKECEEEQRKQLKSPKEKANWCSLKELRAVVHTHKQQLLAGEVFKKEPGTLSKREHNLLQRWLVGSLYIGCDGHPPLRLDYAPMRVVTLQQFNALTEDERGGNYLVNSSRNTKFFSLGSYKTKKTYGEKRIPCTSKLNGVLNQYLRLHTHSHLLLNAKGEAMTANQLTKFLHRTFEPTGKTISCCMLRHIYISEFMTGPSLKERAEVSDKMAHSLSTQELYKKHD
jgi:site-specific recombinase XerD